MILILGIIAMTTVMIAPIASNSSAAISDSGLRVIAMESDPAPAELSGTYSKIDGATVDDSGEIAFSASLSDSTVSSAILFKSGDDTHVLLRSGEQAPDGGRYKKFGELDLSRFSWMGTEGVFLLFRAEMEGSSAPEGVFMWMPDGVRTIALAGGKSPRGSTYNSFAHLTLSATTTSTGVGFSLAFVAEMQEGSKSIITYISVRTPMEALAIGDRLGEDQVTDFVISQMGAVTLSCVADLRSSSNDRRFREVISILDDGAIIHGTMLREGARFDTVGKVKRILAPPAISFQTAFAAVQIKGGVSALAIRDAVGNAGLFAKTGDTAPSLPGETFQNFNPPISNANYPTLGSRGIISAVRLSGGRSALLAWLFKNTIPFEPESRLLLVEGDHLNTAQSPVFVAFSPVKLSNKGMLLLRGTVGEGDAARDGLFVIDGLFDRQLQ